MLAAVYKSSPGHTQKETDLGEHLREKSVRVAVLFTTCSRQDPGRKALDI